MIVQDDPLETISPTKPTGTLRQTVPATPSKATRVLFTPHKTLQYHRQQQDQPSPTPMPRTMPTMPLFSVGSDEESTGLSPQVEALSLGSSDSQASSKEQSKKKKKGKGGGNDVRKWFGTGKGKSKSKGNKGMEVEVNLCNFCM